MALRNPNHQKLTVIPGLAAEIKAAQSELAQFHHEEAPMEIPKDFYGQTDYYMSLCIKNATLKAKETQQRGTNVHELYHHEEIPMGLYTQLHKSENSQFLDELKQLGFEFHLTNEGNFHVQLAIARFKLQF